MKTGRTLQELAAELERQNDSKKDYLADTRSIRISGSDGAVTATLDDIGTFPLDDTAHQQFANVNGIPKPYYDRMLTEAPDLLATNINHWLQAEPKRRMVRTLDGRVRAFLSDRYRPLDNYDLAQAILPKFKELDVWVESVEITPRRMYLKGVTDRIQGEVKEGDIIQAGIVVSNSEVGSGSLKIEELDYRLICCNGMIRAQAIRKTHLGRGSDIVDGAQEFFTDKTRRLDDAAFWNKVVDITTALFDQSRFNKRLDEYREVAERVMEISPVKAIERTVERFNLNESENDSILRHLIQDGDLSQWGVANAITRASQDVDDYERATELESVGGKVVELSREDWRLIAA